MSMQTSGGRRQAALDAAARLGPMTEDVAQAIGQHRARYAALRAERPPERRSGAGDRRKKEVGKPDER